jgi:hypothetical protein
MSSDGKTELYFVELVHEEKSNIKKDYRFMTRRRASAEEICEFLNQRIDILGVEGCDRCDRHGCFFHIIKKPIDIPTYAYADVYYAEGICNTIDKFTNEIIDVNPPRYDSFFKEFMQYPSFKITWLSTYGKELIDVRPIDE